MLMDSVLQSAFRLIGCLHPNRAVAICVLIEACEWISRIKNLQRRRHGYKLQTPENSLIQFSIYSVSEQWEKDQESERPTKHPIYKPTNDDRLIRYVKTLASKSMDWRSLYGAVAVGCLLYRYEPHEVSSLAEDIFKSDNIRRVKSTMSKLIKKRFKNGLSNGNGELRFETPSNHQRTLIQASLLSFAPWNSCSTTQSPSDSLLETYFAKSSQTSEWERLHVLFRLFPKLVDEYNSTFPKGNKMRLADPEKKLGSPKFDGYSNDPMEDDSGGGEPPNPADRFNPAPLTDDEISIIRHSLERNERRRNKFHGSELRIFVDGEEAARVNPLTPESFTIPATASYMEVFGEDEDGELLLAVLPLNFDGFISDSFTQQLSVTGGQKIEVSILHSSEQDLESCEHDAEITENLVFLSYSDLSNQGPSLHTSDHNAEKRQGVGTFGIGKTLARRYRILETLGHGAVGTVYKAEDLRLKKFSAVKIFHSYSESTDEIWGKTLLKSEIAKLARIDHPGVVQVFDVDGLSQIPPYLVMDYVRGVSLEQELRPAGMDLDRIAKLSCQIGQALSFVHDRGILHRDLKPTNILLHRIGDEEHIKICDFGIARVFDKPWRYFPWDSVDPEAPNHSSQQDGFVGLEAISLNTYPYMAPEQLCYHDSSISSDLYAMGAILYEMVTGQRPFVADSVSLLMELQRAGVGVNPCDLRPDLPRAAQDVILRALAFHPEDRYGSAKELGDAIASALTEKPKANQAQRLVDKDATRPGPSWPKVSSSSHRAETALRDILEEIALGNKTVQDLVAHVRFGIVLKRVSKRVCASFRGHSSLTSEDLYQEVCLRLLRWEKVPDPNKSGDERHVFSWLSHVARSILVDNARLMRVKALDAPCNEEDEESLMELEDPGRSPQLDAEINEQTERFLRTLEFYCHDFGEREKDLMALRIQGYSNEEIASAWREDVKTVRVDMNRVMAKVRHRLLHEKRKV